MEFKFGFDELRTIAGQNTPEKIAERLISYRSKLGDIALRNGSTDFVEKQIAADEAKLLELVLAR